MALVVIDLLDELVEGSLIALNDLEMLEQDLLLGITVAQEGQRLPILLFHMRLDIDHEHVGRMVLALVNLLNLGVLQLQLLLLLLKFLVILVCLRVEIFEVEGLDRDLGRAVVVVHVATGDGHVACVRLLDLVDDTAFEFARLWVLLPHVDVVEQHSDTYNLKTERVLLDVEFARVPRVNDVVEVARRRNFIEAVVLLGNNVL